MSYNEVFGGGSINPSQRTYLLLTTAVSVTLQWPIEQQIGGDNVAVDIIDIDATATGLNVDFSDARQVSDGFTSLMTNVGSNTVTIRDSAGGTIISLAPGEAWFIYLTDNSTAAGVWRTFQLGATVSVASASALAGAGLKAISTTLNQRIAPTLTAVTPVTWVDADRAQFTVWTGGVGILDLPAPATVGSDWWSMVRNGGTGSFTVTPPSGTIDGAATLVMDPGASAIVVTDGTNFFTIGLGTSTTGSFDFVQISVAGSGDFVLSGVQLNRISYRFTGVLTGNRKIVVPSTTQEYWVDNSTTGAFDLTVATVAQVTPITVIQNNRAILYCDGTDVVSAESSSFTPPVTIGQGGTGAVTAAAALANLGGAPLTRLINTNALSGLAGGGDLSADRSLLLDTDNLTLENAVDVDVDTINFYDDSATAMRKTGVDNLFLRGIPGALKFSNEDRTTDTSLTLDSALFLTLGVGTYKYSYFVQYGSSTNGPGGLSFSIGVGTATQIGVFTEYQWESFLSGGGNSGTFPKNTANPGNFIAAVPPAGAFGNWLWGTGYVRITVAGTFGFLWGQTISSAIAMRVQQNSIFHAIRVI